MEYKIPTDRRLIEHQIRMLGAAYTPHAKELKARLERALKEAK